MIKVGLTGGYATGKSFVAGELERLGAHVIRADVLGHEVLQPGGEAYTPAVDAFGTRILGPDGFIDRKKLAEIVFGVPELLKTLNGFVHPAVIRREERLLQDYAKADPSGIAVIEAAILIETGRHSAFNRLVLTVCDQETQIARGMKRDHLTREQVLTRLSAQLPADEKKRYADFIIDTSGPKEETVRRVEGIFRELRQLAEARA